MFWQALLSPERLDDNEWDLNKGAFKEICRRFRTPAVDLFAMERNCQVPKFFARRRCNKALGTDALTSTWLQHLLYTFPPIQIISLVIQTVTQQQAEVIIVAPYWPRRLWFQGLKRLQWDDAHGVFQGTQSY